MRLTKFGHSGVRLEHDSSALVIDPGGFTSREAVEDVAAVLVTHEHADHLDLDHLRAADAPIFTIDAVAAVIAAADPGLAERVTVVQPGQQFEAAGFTTEVVGEWHEVIHPDLPRVHNGGYLVDVGGTRVHHPGDALLVPAGEVDVLLAPICAPWMKMSDGIDYARAVGAPRTVGIHEKIWSEAGQGLAVSMFTRLLEGHSEFSMLGEGNDLPH